MRLSRTEQDNNERSHDADPFESSSGGFAFCKAANNPLLKHLRPLLHQMSNISSTPTGFTPCKEALP